MEIQVQETHPPGAGRKMGKVITADGQQFYAYPEIIANLQVGRRYDVKTDSWEDRGRKNHKITEAAPLNGASHAPAGNGAAARSADNGGPPNGGLSTEVAFVRELLKAFIAKGDVAYEKRALYEATLELRALYGATFGRNGGAR